MLGRLVVLKRTKQLQTGQICIMMNFEVYVLTNLITKIKTKVLFEEIINAYTILVGNPDRNRLFCETKTYTVGHN